MSSNFYLPNVVTHGADCKTGVMVAGVNGSNGVALRVAMSDMCRNTHLLGSMTQFGHAQDLDGDYYELRNLLPDRNLFIMGPGWDVSSVTSVREAAKQAGVLSDKIIDELIPENGPMVLPGIWRDGFTTINGKLRADVIRGHETHKNEGIVPMEVCRVLANDIDTFAECLDLERVIVMYSGSTERNVNLPDDIDYAELLESVDVDKLVSPSQMYAVAACIARTRCVFINAAAQQTCGLRGLQRFAATYHTLLIGDDLSTGQTSLKTSIGEYFIKRGIRLESIWSVNALYNNDGYTVGNNHHGDTGVGNASKIATKSSMTSSFEYAASALYAADNEKKTLSSSIDHLVRIDYFPGGPSKDLKRAFDEWTGRTSFGAVYELNVTSRCPDTNLAVGVLLDLIVLSSVIDRTTINNIPVNSRLANALLSVLLKCPQTMEYRRYDDDNAMRSLAPAFFSERHSVLTGFILASHGLVPMSLQFVHTVRRASGNMQDHDQPFPTTDAMTYSSLPSL
jgi:myo-inositol-1-phosphate synthase